MKLERNGRIDYMKTQPKIGSGATRVQTREYLVKSRNDAYWFMSCKFQSFSQISVFDVQTKISAILLLPASGIHTHTHIYIYTHTHTHIYIYIYIKVKWSRYRLGVAQRMGRVIALLFHDRGTRRGWVVSSTPRPHFTPGKDPVPILQ